MTPNAVLGYPFSDYKSLGLATLPAVKYPSYKVLFTWVNEAYHLRKNEERSKMFKTYDESFVLNFIAFQILQERNKRTTMQVIARL